MKLAVLVGYRLGSGYCAGGLTVSCHPRNSLRGGSCDCPHFKDEENEVQYLAQDHSQVKR